MIKIPKLKQTSTKILLGVLGAIYLASFSNLELNFIVKSYVAIIPVQLLGLVFGLYFVSRRQTTNKKPSIDRRAKNTDF